ncbi:MAG: CrcB family protein [Bifidobacteriaceae bacterium]|nr:CrcB family protein [Bifidobacteriaceae bacterium]
MEFVLLCICGGLGAVSRFVVDTTISRNWKFGFPLGTFIINIIAAFCAGIAIGAYDCSSVYQMQYLLFTAGFLGGFSTFSTAVTQVVNQINNKKYCSGIIYGIFTVIVPLIFAVIGWNIL